MKRIEIDEDIYTYIAANTEHIGESASDILRRLLKLEKNSSAQQAAVGSAAPLQSGRVFDIMTSEDLATEKSAVARFLFILSMLYRSHNEDFRAVLDIKGRDRIYFATSEEALLTSGNSTNPKQIPQSPYWVITNNNTTKKKSMLTSVARELGYSDSEAEKIRDFL
ncbi:replication initiation negative regulator SeqA [Aliidiomarina minuta]|uniref:Negative modulator of initiation of replication n=1 Tax=Aliidiomarina minuta TaxID=880057 RepID=A0A432W7C2_9GAMM|nr:replication initiation negative regulator SeqA [Aliidiomarina minuta]RUO25899.1 replication initiation negative regulator SeqA [Aliidiomarina minuta]